MEQNYNNFSTKYSQCLLASETICSKKRNSNPLGSSLRVLPRVPFEQSSINSSCFRNKLVADDNGFAVSRKYGRREAHLECSALFLSK